MMPRMDDTAAGLKAFREGAVAKSVLPEIVELARSEGILRLLEELSPFSPDRLCAVLERELGYVLGGNRRRMIEVLLDLFAELGWCVQDGSAWRWAPVRTAREGIPELLPDRPAERAPSSEDGQSRFFLDCLKGVPSYLRGAPPTFGFERGNVEAWDRFLGCEEFRLCRGLLLQLMEVADRPAFRLLDLCHGPGWGIAEAAVRYPEIRITAIDFTGAFAEAARERLRAAAGERNMTLRAAGDVRWIDPGTWRGFGSPLPFGSCSFDSVLFSGVDPYIPRPLRRDVYAEIARVLAPGGRLGILTRGYPDAARRDVPSRGMRIAALVHDFAESVCEGWEGFAEPEATRRMFGQLGYREGGEILGGMSYLESSLWVLRKGEGRA